MDTGHRVLEVFDIIGLGYLLLLDGTDLGLVSGDGLEISNPNNTVVRGKLIRTGLICFEDWPICSGAIVLATGDVSPGARLKII